MLRVEISEMGNKSSGVLEIICIGLRELIVYIFF